ncbi:hypothetical protein Zmor_000849 [Zophobas morio]|uniref:Uncharacterized protein n=1 Tax=Zophobas morio TaxID=2755281 RepID=A0AA38J3L9_9CUCU|nr:hypothetical protein Zmor_000849 [Zophobas morio]
MVMGASVVQHLRDHGTFNLKLTIVAVIGQKEEVGFSQLAGASYIKRIRPHPYHVDKVHGLESTDCSRCVTHFLSDGTPRSRQQVRFQETVFDKCVSVG